MQRFANSAALFEGQSQVMNGILDLFLKVFREADRYACVALGTGNVLGGVPVAIEIVA